MEGWRDDGWVVGEIAAIVEDAGSGTLGEKKMSFENSCAKKIQLGITTLFPPIVDQFSSTLFRCVSLHCVE